MALSLPHTKASSSSGANRYHVLAPLGEGGMARVDLALQVGTSGFERLVAVKRVSPELADADMAAMFLEESRIAARLNHPHLIHAYELGHDEQGSFLAMEYLSGQSYRRILQALCHAGVDFRFALEVLIATLSGLEHVHELTDIAGEPLRLVHRDVSPSNVFVCYSGQIKVLDFGIAKSRESEIRTQVGVRKGKLEYMAPEQLSVGAVDARADLYAVGVMLWEAIAGHRRWSNAGEGVITSHLLSHKPAPPAGASARGLPQLAEQICAQALAPKPEDRFQNAAAFRHALEALALQLGPRLTVRAIGEYVSSRFALERAEERAVVVREMAALKNGLQPTAPEASPPSTSLMRMKAPETRLLARPEQPEQSETAALAVPDTVDNPTTLSEPAPRARGPRPLRTLAILALLLTGMLVVFAVRPRGASLDNLSSSRPGTSSPVAAPVALPVAAPVLQPAPTAPNALAELPQPPAPSKSRAPTRRKAPSRKASPAKLKNVPAPPTVASSPPSRPPLALDRDDPWK